MRKFYLMIVLGLLLQACSVGGGIPFEDVLFPPTDTPLPSSTPTITLTPTVTATFTRTPSITPSATIVRIPTQDPNLPTSTFAPIPIFIGDNTATPISTPTLFSPGAGFLSVEVSDARIYWGVCSPNQTKITARVQDEDDVYNVIIFVQVKSAKKEDYTPWTTGDAMHDYNNGSFSYILKANNIDGHNHYKNSWVRFQLVAVNFEGEEIGRTMIYTEAIALSPCM